MNKLPSRMTAIAIKAPGGPEVLVPEDARSPRRQRPKYSWVCAPRE